MKRAALFGLFVSIAALITSLLIFSGSFSSATHVPSPTFRVDTLVSGTTYTDDPNFDFDASDNSLATGTIQLATPGHESGPTHRRWPDDRGGEHTPAD